MCASAASGCYRHVFVRTSVEDACIQEACMGGRRRVGEVRGEYGRRDGEDGGMPRQASAAAVYAKTAL